MTIDEFEKWLQDNPTSSRRLVDAAWSECDPIPPMPGIPAIYDECLTHIGPVMINDYILMGRQNIACATAFVRDLAYPDEGVLFEHLVPFCDLGYDMCYLCFDKNQIVFFDPLEPGSINRIIASSFEEFLDRLTGRERFS